MGRYEVLTQQQAWRENDHWLQDERVEQLDELESRGIFAI